MKYRALIALEMHCQISKTNSKVFSRARNKYTTKPNVNIRPLDMAFPGVLPVVNKEAVRKALMISMILGCKQPLYMYFERKNYYYPDLPKGFQITQETKPAPVGIYGELEYEVGDEVKVAKINNIHLEEDSAGMDHYSKVSTIDYNRSGIPLLELVTEPCFESADEAVAFLETMRSIYQYADVSEADSKKGQIRCDVNVSIMDASLDASDPANWGTKVETKNVNSFSAVRDVINYEIKRQTELKENGTYDEMEQQTRRYDEASGATVYMRSKADAIDYKYFVEPNIPKFKITPEWLSEIRESIPPLAGERKEKYINEYGLKATDARVLVKEKAVADYFEEVVKGGVEPVDAANWMNTVILGSINKLEVSIEDFFIRPETLAKLVDLVKEGKISRNQAKTTLYKAVAENKDPILIVKEEGLEQIQDEGSIVKVVEEVLSENETQVNDYLEKGLTNIVNYLLGQVMKKTQGKANPARAMEILKSELDKRK